MKKELIISTIIVTLIAGCDEGRVCNHPVKNNIEYVEEYCPKCNGIGEVELTVGEKVLWGVVTFGGGFMFETMECSMCNGTGVVKKRKLRE